MTNVILASTYLLVAAARPTYLDPVRAGRLAVAAIVWRLAGIVVRVPRRTAIRPRPTRLSI